MAGNDEEEIASAMGLPRNDMEEIGSEVRLAGNDEEEIASAMELPRNDKKICHRELTFFRGDDLLTEEEIASSQNALLAMTWRRLVRR